MKRLLDKAKQIRRAVMQLVVTAKMGHIGGDFSEIEILVALYYKYLRISPATQENSNRDRFVLSKGHSVEALYCILADLSFFSTTDLATYGKFGSRFIGHPHNKIPGIEMNTGSLGHGLALGVGMALAGKMDAKAYYTYVVMGDGEVEEGSVWEAAMAGAHYKLDHLIAFVDKNGLQISGSTEQVMAHENLEERWRAFGWEVLSINGNDLEQVCMAIETAHKIVGKPIMIVAHTIKGKGCPFMENKVEWHHRVPTDEEFRKFMQQMKRDDKNDCHC
jgi:transketolase